MAFTQFMNQFSALIERQQYGEAEKLLRAEIQRAPQDREYRSLLRAVMVWADRGTPFGTSMWYQPLVSMGFQGFRTRDYVPYYRERIPRIVLRNLQDLKHITHVIALPFQNREVTVYRGQVCDYFTKGDVSLESALLRQRLSSAKVRKAIRDWRVALKPFLGDLACGPFRSQNTWAMAFTPVPHIAGRMIEFLREPELGGTMQHYGFPTDYLDVTRNPQVALWFALHCGQQGPDGIVRYSRHRWSHKSGMSNWPSIYAISLPRWQMVDLTDGCIAEFASQRVLRQNAALASSLVYHDPALNPISILGLKQEVRRVHVAVVLILKLHPAGDWASAELPPPGWYFPSDDPVQQNLQTAGAEFLRRYYGTAASLCHCRPARIG